MNTSREARDVESGTKTCIRPKTLDRIYTKETQAAINYGCWTGTRFKTGLDVLMIDREQNWQLRSTYSFLHFHKRHPTAVAATAPVFFLFKWALLTRFFIRLLKRGAPLAPFEPVYFRRDVL